jgi:nucleotide-binding universal stress UspA family protein
MDRHVVYNKILITTDFSELAESAFKYAVDFARQSGAKLLLLSVVEPRAVLPHEAAYIPSLMVAEEASSQLSSTLSALNNTIKESGLFQGLEVIPKVEFGHPHQTIIDVSKSEKCDLIVMASHGRSGFQHFVMGSVAEKVIRAAQCPVLITPALKKN